MTSSIDTRFKVVKTDFIVPATQEFIRAPIQASIGVDTSISTTQQETALSFPVSDLGRLVVCTIAGGGTSGWVLPTASAVTAYWGAVPGDVFSSTILNVGTTASGFVNTTTLGIGTTMSHTAMVTGVGYKFDYVMGGSISTPSALVYIS